MELFSDLGKMSLMFTIGLELDLEPFRRTRNKSIGFGAMTALVPLLVGTTIALGFGLNPPSMPT